jgi:hypothetical protein
MVDDKVFEGDGGTQTTDAPSGTQAPIPTAEQIAAALEAKIDEKIGPIEKSQEQLNQFLLSLKEQASQRIEEPNPSGDAPDWATKFYNEPQGTVQQEIDTRTAPIVQQAATTMGKILIDQKQEQIDKTYGEGVWDKYFKEPISKAVADAARDYPGSLMNPVAIDNAVNTVKGRDEVFNALVSALAEKSKADGAGPDEELVESVANKLGEQYQLMGGIRRAQTGGVEKFDDPDSEDYLAQHFKQTGTPIDKDELAKVLNMKGNSLKDYKAAIEEKK